MGRWLRSEPLTGAQVFIHTFTQECTTVRPLDAGPFAADDAGHGTGGGRFGGVLPSAVPLSRPRLATSTLAELHTVVVQIVRRGGIPLLLCGTTAAETAVLGVVRRWDGVAETADAWEEWFAGHQATSKAARDCWLKDRQMAHTLAVSTWNAETAIRKEVSPTMIVLGGVAAAAAVDSRN
jgi:hypothetical protein